MESEPCWRRIRECASVHRILSAQMSPGNLLLNLDLRLERSIVIKDMPEAIQGVEGAIRDKFPMVKEVFIEVQAFSVPKDATLVDTT